MSPGRARTRTAQSGNEDTNRESTAPPFEQWIECQFIKDCHKATGCVAIYYTLNHHLYSHWFINICSTLEISVRIEIVSLVTFN